MKNFKSDCPVLDKFSDYIDTKNKDKIKISVLILRTERICEDILRSTSDTPKVFEYIKEEEFDVPQE